MFPPASTCSLRLRAAGVTLIEMMVVIVVLGVLAAIVLPSYQQSLYKSRRSDAMAALGAMQQAQERWRGSCIYYYPPPPNTVVCNGDTSALQAASSPSGYYDLSIVANSVSATGYTMRAAANAGAKQAGDSACQVFEVQLANGSVAYRSYAGGGAQNGAPDPCWVK